MLKILERLLNYLEKIHWIKKEELPSQSPSKINPKESKEITMTSIPPHENIIDRVVEYPFGTILWANRYETEEEKNAIPQGHRDGPFIVVGKDSYGLICLYATGKPPKDTSFQYRTVTLSQNEYSDILTKDTYIYVANDISLSKEHIINELGHLNKKDQKILLKKIGIVKDEQLYINHQIEVATVPLEEGDIFSKDDKDYLIISKNSQLYVCLPLIKGLDINYIRVDNVRYTPDFKNVFELSNIEGLKRTNVIGSNLLASILIRYQSYLDFQKNYGIIKRGSIVTENSHYYYINGEIGDTFTGYQIYQGNHPEMAKFIIGQNEFFTDFKKPINFLQKEHPYTFYTNATESEMEAIKEAKKSYTKSHKSHKKTSKKVKEEAKKMALYEPNIQSGAIVNYMLNNTSYIVISRQDKKLIVMSKSNYDTFNYSLEELELGMITFESRMHPLAFKTLLKELRENAPVIRGHISKEKLQKIIEHPF